MKNVLLVDGSGAGRWMEVADVLRHGDRISFDPPPELVAYKPPADLVKQVTIRRETYKLHVWHCGDHDERWIGAPAHWQAADIFDELCKVYAHWANK